MIHGAGIGTLTVWLLIETYPNLAGAAHIHIKHTKGIVKISLQAGHVAIVKHFRHLSKAPQCFCSVNPWTLYQNPFLAVSWLIVTCWCDLAAMSCKLAVYFKNIMIVMCRRQFEMEMARHMEEHMNFPSIVMYVIFNEGTAPEIILSAWLQRKCDSFSYGPQLWKLWNAFWSRIIH